MGWMTWRRTAIGSIGFGLAALVGCAPTVKPGDVDTTAYDLAARHPHPAPPAATVAGHAQVPDDADAKNYGEMPTPPQGARYTIVCQTYNGADHAANARQVRDVLRSATPLRKWYIVHEADKSTLYYGFYRTIDRRDKTDAAEGERALADLNAIRTLHDSVGSRLFPQSLPVPIDSPNPTANPQWDITRSGGYWSLEVAVFKDSADRKERAVEAVADARKQGIPAYYYHADNFSSVLIGAWPKAAASMVTPEQQNANPESVLLMTQSPVPDAVRTKLGDNVQAVAPHLELNDPAMAAAMQQFPDHSVNGSTLMKQDKDGNPTNESVEHSFWVKVPVPTHVDPAAVADPAMATPANADEARAAADAAAAARGEGKLPSLDGK